MKITIAVLASLMLLASVNVSNANIIFTPLVTSSSNTATNSTYIVRLVMTGVGGNAASNTVSTYGFSASVLGAPLVGNITSSNVENGQLPFSAEFATHSVGTSGPNPIPFSSTNNAGAFSVFDNPADPNFNSRYREISFTVARPINGPANLSFAFASASGGFTGGAIPNFTTSNAITFNSQTGQSTPVIISAVPEPTSMALVALVGCVVAGARLRRRNAIKKSVALQV